MSAADIAASVATLALLGASILIQVLILRDLKRRSR